MNREREARPEGHWPGSNSSHSMLSPINADGPRPAVGWVCSLPHKWTTDAERLVLVVIAADIYPSDTGRPANTSGISLPDLSRATGIWKDRLSRVLATLRSATDRRPALLAVWVERDGADGGRTYQRLTSTEVNAGGRGKRTLYQLLTEATEAARNHPEDSRTVGDPEANNYPGSTRTDQLETVRENRPGKPSGYSPAPPIPFPSPTHLHNSSTDGPADRPLAEQLAELERRMRHEEAVNR